MCRLVRQKKKQKRIKIGYELWQNKRARRSDRFLCASFRRRRFIVVVLYLFALLFWLSFYCFSIQTFKWWIFLSLCTHKWNAYSQKNKFITLGMNYNIRIGNELIGARARAAAESEFQFLYAVNWIQEH
jgi:hypothetical protein